MSENMVSWLEEVFQADGPFKNVQVAALHRLQRSFQNPEALFFFYEDKEGKRQSVESVKVTSTVVSLSASTGRERSEVVEDLKRVAEVIREQITDVFKVAFDLGEVPVIVEEPSVRYVLNVVGEQSQEGGSVETKLEGWYELIVLPLRRSEAEHANFGITMDLRSHIFCELQFALMRLLTHSYPDIARTHQDEIVLEVCHSILPEMTLRYARKADD